MFVSGFLLMYFLNKCLDKWACSRRCDHRWMGVLPAPPGRWHHQFRATGILPRQLPGRHRGCAVWLRWFTLTWLTVQAGDQRWMRTISSSLHLLHSLYGPFSKLHGIGRFSKVPRLRLFQKHHFNISSWRCIWRELLCSDGQQVLEGAGGGGRAEESRG